MKRLVPLALLILLLAVAAAGAALYQYRQFTAMPLAVGQNGVVITVEAGEARKAGCYPA
jgi:type IV secretory pathway TrbF-like protein